jgi:hypothetical protein
LQAIITIINCKYHQAFIVLNLQPDCSTASQAQKVSSNRMEGKYRYLGYFMALLIPLVFFAFYKSYFISFPQFSQRINIFDHVHATISVIWMLMLIVQPILIKNKLYKTHRIIGKASYMVFPLLILSFIPREIILFHSDNSKDLFFPVADTFVLVPLYVLAIYNKKNVARHMRYFIASALVLLGPTIGRIGYAWMHWTALTTQHVQYAVIYTILISLILYDGQNLKKSKPYLVAIAFFLMHQLTYYIIFL